MEAPLKFALIVAAAACEAGDSPANAAHAGEIFCAFRTTIDKASRARTRRKWQGVAARFITNPEIATGLAPLGTMRRNAVASTAGMRDEMRELMTQGAIDFRLAVLAKARIE